MTITIREATEDDFAEIVGLFKEFAHFERLDERMVNSADRMKTEQAYFNCFVAVNSDDMIVGYATHFFAYFTWTGKSLYMDDLYVREAFRGKGIGTMLLQKVIDYARNSGCHKLRWQVSHWNTPAICMYKGIGAEIDAQERNCDLDLSRL